MDSFCEEMNQKDKKKYFSVRFTSKFEMIIEYVSCL
jgi:hypothetical protein